MGDENVFCFTFQSDLMLCDSKTNKVERPFLGVGARLPTHPWDLSGLLD